MIPNPTQSMILAGDIEFQLNYQITDLLSKHLNNETISNMETFIKAFLKCLADIKIKQKIPKLSEQALIGNIEKEFRQRITGCD